MFACRFSTEDQNVAPVQTLSLNFFFAAVSGVLSHLRIAEILWVHIGFVAALEKRILAPFHCLCRCTLCTWMTFS